jgi:hypothetical protein
MKARRRFEGLKASGHLQAIEAAGVRGVVHQKYF